jgi:hypothetical protein
MNAYILAVAFSGNHDKKESFILTKKESPFSLPLIKMEYPKFFHQEIKTIVTTFFQGGSVKISEEVSFNFLAINNEYAMNYVKSNYKEFNEETDLLIVYGGILLNYPCTDHYKWTNYLTNTKFNGFSKDMNLNLLIDYVIKNTTL